MKKGPAVQMKVYNLKKPKVERITAECISNIKNISLTDKLAPSIKIPADLIKVFHDIDPNDSVLKSQIINTALTRFLKNKQPKNQYFRKFLKNFHKFNVFSLLCAYGYMQTAEISSKGDIRTFIYTYLGFNILSTKYIDDYSVWNSSLIKLWGLTLFQASQLEIFALKNINYNLRIDINQISDIFSNSTDK